MFLCESLWRKEESLNKAIDCGMLHTLFCSHFVDRNCSLSVMEGGKERVKEDPVITTY